MSSPPTWPQRLVDRSPVVSSQHLLAALVPPPQFAGVDFDSYIPNPEFPSQAAAVEAMRVFATRVGTAEPVRRSWFRRAPTPPEMRSGIYLDGGFGVGKTHLLAALWHGVPEPKVFCTFVELTYFVGALGFATAVDRLGDTRLLCIDEFELDDPGDTVLMSSLLTQLVERGVNLAATSNTLPGKLGEGRFAADDFLREIQQLSAQFDVIRVDGADYRHRELATPPEPLSAADLEAVMSAAGEGAVLDDFGALLAHLANVHPSQYGALLEGVSAVGWRGVRTIDDQAIGLRMVVLIDRLYDRGLSVHTSGVRLDQLFSAELVNSGFRKKYLRALSRIGALTDAG